MNQTFREPDLVTWEEEALDAIGIADADLDMAFFQYAGAFEDGAAFSEDAPGGVEDLTGGKTFDLNLKQSLIFNFCVHKLNHRAVQFPQDLIFMQIIR